MAEYISDRSSMDDDDDGYDSMRTSIDGDDYDKLDERVVRRVDKYTPNTLYDWNEHGELVEIEDDYVDRDVVDTTAREQELMRRVYLKRKQEEEMQRRATALQSKLKWCDETPRVEEEEENDRRQINSNFVAMPADAINNKRRQRDRKVEFKNSRAFNHFDIRYDTAGNSGDITLDKKMKFKFCQRLYDTGKCDDKFCGYCHSVYALKNFTRECKFREKCRFIENNNSLFYVERGRSDALNPKLVELILCKSVFDDGKKCNCGFVHDVETCVERNKISDICLPYIKYGVCDCTAKWHDEELMNEFRTRSKGIVLNRLYLNKSARKICNFLHPNENIRNFIYRTCRHHPQ